MIADGIPWVDSAEALVLGPTGLALAANGTLYVASTDGSKILAISEAMTRTTPAAKGGTVLTEGGHLKEPLGMVLAPNGNIITSNGGDGNMVETTPAGQQVAVQTADKKTGAGTLFGLVIAPEGKGIYFVDDGENTLNLLSESQAGASTESSTTAATPTSTKRDSVSGQGTAFEPRGGLSRTLLADIRYMRILLRVGVAALEARERRNRYRVCGAEGGPTGGGPRPKGGGDIIYAGWPLYTYEADWQPPTRRVEAKRPWYVIAPSGKVITTG